MESMETRTTCPDETTREHDSRQAASMSWRQIPCFQRLFSRSVVRAPTEKGLCIVYCLWAWSQVRSICTIQIIYLYHTTISNSDGRSSALSTQSFILFRAVGNKEVVEPCSGPLHPISRGSRLKPWSRTPNPYARSTRAETWMRGSPILLTRCPSNRVNSSAPD